MIEIPKKVLIDAIKTFGEEHQLKIAIEEMSELTKAICKTLRSDRKTVEDYEAVCEEMADVIIMINQLKLIYNNIDGVEWWVNEKIERLERTIEEHQKQKVGE